MKTTRQKCLFVLGLNFFRVLGVFGGGFALPSAFHRALRGESRSCAFATSVAFKALSRHVASRYVPSFPVKLTPFHTSFHPQVPEKSALIGFNRKLLFFHSPVGTRSIRVRFLPSVPLAPVLWDSPFHLFTRSLPHFRYQILSDNYHITIHRKIASRALICRDLRHFPFALRKTDYHIIPHRPATVRERPLRRSVTRGQSNQSSYDSSSLGRCSSVAGKVPCLTRLSSRFYGHQAGVLQQAAEFLFRDVMMRPFRGGRIVHRFVFHFKSLEVNNPQILIARFPELALLKLEHIRKDSLREPAASIKPD